MTDSARRSHADLARAVFEHRGLGVAITDTEGRFIDVNNAFAEMVGYENTELVGRRFHDITHPEDRVPNHDLFEALRVGEVRRFTFDKRYLHKDGREVPVRVSISALCNEGGRHEATVAVVEDRSAVHAAEQEARRVRALLERGVRLAGLGVWSADPVSGALEWTDQALALFGLSREEFGGTIESFIARVHPEDRQWVKSRLAEADATTGLVDNEYRIVRGDGRVRIMIDRGEVVREPSGHLRRVGLVMDVTEQREAERLLRLSEERFRLLARATSDAIWDWNLVTDELWWGDGLEALFGFSRAQVAPTIASWTSRIHPDDLDHAYRDVKEAIASGRDSWVGRYRFRRVDGTYAFVEDRGHIIRGEDGVAVRMIGGMTDQTEQRAAVARSTQQAALLDEVSDAILVLDADLVITSWSRGAERLFGVGEADALGRSVIEVLALDTMTVGAAKTRIAEGGEWSGEVVVATGRVRVTTLARWKRLQRDGEPHAILAIHTDLTQQKLLEAQTLRAQRIESIGTLAGGIAHDLNNVLAPILMAIDYLRSDETDPDRADILATIERSAERGADMVRQLLTFARGVGGRREPVDVKRLVDEVVQILDETLLKSITVHTSVPAVLSWILGDATQLHQVLLNLCINARDAMSQGGTLRIALEETRLDATFSQQIVGAHEGAYLVVSVEDTGVGMSAEVIDRIFDPFYTTKEVGRGTGLGLSTSLAIVKNHGGFIRVSSEPGRGSRFLVYLPIDDMEEVARDAPPVEPPRGRGELLMVVDDEASVRTVTRRTLEHYGYRVVLATDGADAIAAFVKHKAELALVITDLMMPVMDGSALVAVLRKMAPELPILAATGVQGGTSLQRVEALGVHQVLFKPYTARALLEAIRQALDE
jgi:PAS domain S-box-containing protein